MYLKHAYDYHLNGNSVLNNADVVSGRSNGYGDTNSFGRKLLQSGECSVILLLDKHPRLIMTVHELSCIEFTEIINLASPQQCNLQFCTAWCCLFAQAGLHTHCLCRSVMGQAQLFSHILQLA